VRGFASLCLVFRDFDGTKQAVRVAWRVIPVLAAIQLDVRQDALSEENDAAHGKTVVVQRHPPSKMLITTRTVHSAPCASDQVPSP
jgi:hypothetical protein